MHKG
jgi:hypothetical protein